uniref:C2H2-type domain-containing protein n=1 Tax=Bubo bubo TaxID=30461 RepID=A0A8C0ECV6_BUBBB
PIMPAQPPLPCRDLPEGWSIHVQPPPITRSTPGCSPPCWSRRLGLSTHPACQPREEQRGMLQGPEEEPQSPTVDVEHDGQRQPDDTQGNHGPRRPRKCSFKGTYAGDLQEDTAQPRSRSREKEPKCELCGKVFSWRTNLTHHRRTHTGEKPYKCWDCGRGFTLRGNLQRHHRAHTKEKPFPCTMCGKHFSCSSNLVVHQRVHTGERTYPCSHCGETFKDIRNLWRHQETLHKEANTHLEPAHPPQGDAEALPGMPENLLDQVPPRHA